MLAVAGCGDDGGDGARATGGVEVTDQRGRTIELERPARRIVTIPIPAASMVIAVDGGPQRLVGMNPASRDALEGEILGRIFPQAAKIPADVADEEFAPNVESLVALDPDVVVQWGDRGSEVIAPMESAGLDVVGLTYGTQEDLERWLATFGTLLGKEARARRMVDDMHRDLDALRASRSPAGERPRILYFNRVSEGLEVSGKGTYNDFTIELAGGVNAAHGVKGMAPVNPEQVIAWDPDIILVGNFDAATPRDFYRDEAFADVAAVRSRRVY